MRKRDRNVAIGTLIAASIGYAAGVLTAPRSGKETRKDLQAAAVKAKKEAETKFKNLHNELSCLITLAKKSSKKLAGSKKLEFEKVLSRAQKAKIKVGAILSAIHEGDADDDDLQKAIEEVNNAINHLKEYVEKDSKTR